MKLTLYCAKKTYEEIEVYEKFCEWQNISLEIIDGLEGNKKTRGGVFILAEIEDKSFTSFFSFVSYLNEIGLVLC